MIRSDAISKAPKTLLAGPVAFKTFVAALAVLVGLAGGMIVARNVSEAPHAADKAPIPAKTDSSPLFVVVTQPDGSLGCNDLKSEPSAEEGLVVIHSAGGSVDVIRCKSVASGGVIGLGLP